MDIWSTLDMSNVNRDIMTIFKILKRAIQISWLHVSLRVYSSDYFCLYGNKTKLETHINQKHGSVSSRNGNMV